MATSATLLTLVVTILLWLSLRRVSDVAIVVVGLVLSLMWMQGLIGWAIILGQRYGMEVIFRSQFSNLLPILVLALGIDDSLHALHRYKEERRGGASPEQAARTSVSRVGRAILLTSTTTIVAFMANMTSNIAALRSFGIEAGLGVLSAFILTGLWEGAERGYVRCHIGHERYDSGGRGQKNCPADSA
jgi:predicted RND superfamily exporter protein